MSAVIFDVDGTLCDTTGIVYLIHDQDDLDAFHRASAECPRNPWVENEFYRWWASSDEIIVVTGRSERWRGLTEKWLTDHGFSGCYTHLYMRPEGDNRSGWEFKQSLLPHLRAEHGDILHAYDDDPRIVHMWARNDIPATMIPGWAKKVKVG